MKTNPSHGGQYYSLDYDTLVGTGVLFLLFITACLIWEFCKASPPVDDDVSPTYGD